MRGFHHATILSSSFHGVRKERLAQWPPISDPKTTKMPGGGGTSRKIGWGCAARFLKPLLDYTLFQTKICDFRPDALKPGAWPGRVTSCYGTYTVVGVSIKREMVLSPNDGEVANSSQKNTPNSRLEWSKLIPYFRPERLKNNTL